ncbi:MAG: ABC transporter permease [Clostridia bacterium]|nr:ABC transporter permease [Clostridia bacterium]
MFSFALKNLLTRKSKTILSALSIIMATTIGLLAFNISSQVSDGIVNTVGFYDILVGPSGSSTDLVLNTMFFTGSPLGKISYEYYENLLEDSRVNVAVPFAMGDNFGGYKLIGTKPEFLENLTVKNGEMFTEGNTATIGANVAKKMNLSVGSTFVSSHGVSGTGHKHENNPYTVVGILKKTNTAYDNVIFVNVEDIWHAHEHHEEGEEHEEHEEDEEHGEHEEEEEHEHDHEEGDLTAVLVKTKNPMVQQTLLSELKEQAGIQAITPMVVAREIMNNVDLSKQIIYALCVVIGIMALLIIYIMALLNMHDSKKDIKLMRLIGISKGRINLVLVIQNFIVTAIAIIVSVLLCRVLLMLVNNFTSSMGIVIDSLRFYSLEAWIILGIFIFSFIPIFVANIKSFKNDPLKD